MDAEDGTRIFRELTIGNRIPCQLEWDGKRYRIVVPIYSERGWHTVRLHEHTRPGDMRDLLEEEMAIVMGLATKSKLICELQQTDGVMTIW